jgi:hypothetical protein
MSCKVLSFPERPLKPQSTRTSSTARRGRSFLDFVNSVGDLVARADISVETAHQLIHNWLMEEDKRCER